MFPDNQVCGIGTNPSQVGLYILGFCEHINQNKTKHNCKYSYSRIIKQKPRYLVAERLQLRKPIEGQAFNHRLLNTIRVPNGQLSASKSAFFVRGASLWNMLPLVMRSGMKVVTFKRELRKWIQERISIKPP